ncbi:MAG: sigma-70 family RNA polymerase sigma factor [Anaerorhabdus sp.]
MNDYELLYYWRQKEELGLQTLRQRYQAFVYKIVNTCLSSVKQCESYKEDLADEAFLSLMEAVEFYQESQKCSFGSFFYTCAYRRVKSSLRHHLREANYANLYAISLNAPLREEEGVYLSDYCTDRRMSDPADLLKYKEWTFEIENIIKKLKKKERQVWQMYQAGASYVDGANKVGCTVKKYDNILQKIKRKIREVVEK